MVRGRCRGRGGGRRLVVDARGRTRAPGLARGAPGRARARCRAARSSTTVIAHAGARRVRGRDVRRRSSRRRGRRARAPVVPRARLRVRRSRSGRAGRHTARVVDPAGHPPRRRLRRCGRCASPTRPSTRRARTTSNCAASSSRDRRRSRGSIAAIEAWRHVVGDRRRRPRLRHLGRHDGRVDRQRRDPRAAARRSSRQSLVPRVPRVAPARVRDARGPARARLRAGHARRACGGHRGARPTTLRHSESRARSARPTPARRQDRLAAATPPSGFRSDDDGRGSLRGLGRGGRRPRRRGRCRAA